MLTLWRKWIAYPIGWLVLIVALLAVLAVVSGWGGKQPEMEAFHGRYEATHADDQVRLRVEEEITVRLAQERGIIRDLVTTYGQARLDVSNITVVDENGDGIRFHADHHRRNGDIEIRIGDPNKRLSGEHTYVIGYTINNAMVGTGDHQELYFNTNGTEWSNGFKAFTATLTLDDTLAAHLSGRTDCFEGTAGSRKHCDLQRNGNVFNVEVPGGLAARENVTLDIGFEPGTISSPLPPYKARSHGWLGIAIMIGIGLLALGISLVARWFVRDLRHGETGVVTQFTPPKNIDPVLAADFLGRPEKGAAAHLAWLVLNGHATITSSQERDESTPRPGSDDLSTSKRAELEEHLRLRWDRETLPSRLRTLTKLLFGDPDTYLPLSTYRRTSDLFKAQHYRDRAVDDLFLRQDSHLGPAMLWIGYLFLIGYGAFQVWIGLAGLGWWFLLGGVVATILLLWAVHLAPAHGRLTAEGRELRRYLMGLEHFVTASEANRIAWLQNAGTAPREDDRVQLYERLLPWAIIFGAERSWAQLLGTMYDRFPELRTPGFPRLALASHQWEEQDRSFYSVRNIRSRRSPWYSRSDIGEGSLSKGFNSAVESVGNAGSGRSSSNTSTRSSGRGWSGGSSSSSGRSSGGGTGGGGGGRW